MFIALSGGEIVSTRYIAVVGEERFRSWEASLFSRSGSCQGVRVEFRGRGRSDVQTIIYVKRTWPTTF